MSTVYEECEHGEVVDDAFACTPCATGGRRPVFAPPPYVTAEARFSGPCVGCDGWIDEGDRIVLVDGDWICGREGCGL